MSSARAPIFSPSSPLAYTLYYLFYLSVILRALLRSPAEGSVAPFTYGLLAVFLAFSVIQVPLSRRWAPWTHIHLALMCGLIIALLRTVPRLDYYAVLFIALAIVSSSLLPRRASIVWLAVICFLVCAGLALAFSPREAASYAPSYIAGSLIIGMTAWASRRAEEARARSEELASRLQEANRQLRGYAEEAEEAAAAQERARLARDLHDAATQTVFSMNLTAEAARMALTRDPDRVPGMLERLQELARDALAEMRSLVDQLRPQSIKDIGLVRALERHVEARQRRDGLTVSLSVEGEESGDPAVREELFRSAREALSNVVKHAGVASARVELRFGPEEAAIRVSDTGRGFDPAADRRPESFGLLSLQERAQALGGSAEVRSEPGKGTQVDVKLPLERAQWSR
ncbi:MAG TPA: sensor histidine kinase [Spirochaetia bacterium]|nr:sensor histidine kinase [Spirochaetia bacterium]